MSAEQSGPVGVLAINLGTPDSPSTGDVRRYLREFLSDPRVIDIHPLARWLLLNLVILPFRPAKSAEAYQAIWTPEGSPLLVHGRAFEAALQEELGARYRVALAMRYGKPGIAAALESLAEAGCRRLVLFPLYPQEASSTTGSSLEAAEALVGSSQRLATVPAFFGDEAVLEAQAAIVREAFEGHDLEQVLFSYHGVPERHVKKDDPTGTTCLASSDCCAKLREENARCYRAQCFEQSRRLAEKLELEIPWEVAFQSRLGRDPWISPYFDIRLDELAGSGVKRVGVVSGSFVADCLETLEEIGIRGREDFEAAGGEELVLAPSLNTDARWVAAAAGLVRTVAAAFA